MNASSLAALSPFAPRRALPDSNALPVSRPITGHHDLTTVAISPSPARGDIIKPGVSTPGRDTRPPKPSEPRKGRHHKARRVNAGERHASAQTIRAPQGATS